MNVEAEVKGMKKELEQAKRENSECEGALKALMTQLAEYDFDSLEEAELEIQNCERKLEKIKKITEKRIAVLKEEWIWNSD